MNRLQGKVAIVTGGAVGIGRACVERMAAEGAKVALFDTLEAEGAALAAALSGRGQHVAFWKVDVTHEAAMRAAIDAAAARFGGLHVLVSNAGISGTPKPTDQVSEAEWDHVQAVNVKGVFFGTKHAVPHLRAAGGGSIINLSSIAGMVGVGGIAPYHASKGAVRLMSKNDAITCAPSLMILRPRRLRRGRCTPWATWANPRTSPGRWCISHRTSRSSSPGRNWWSTAAIPRDEWLRRLGGLSDPSPVAPGLFAQA